MDPEQATSFKQLFMSMLPNDGGIVVGTVTSESPLTIKIENDKSSKFLVVRFSSLATLPTTRPALIYLLLAEKSTAILISAERMGTTLTCWIPVLVKSLA